MRKRNILLSLILMVLIIFSSCKKEEKSLSDSRLVMGTSASITIYSTNPDQEILNEAFEILYNLDRDLSANSDTSYIAMINQRAGEEAVRVPDEVYGLIKRAMRLCYETDGAFNPAIGALTDLWGFLKGNTHRPDDEKINKALDLVDYNDVVLNDEEKGVYLKKKGMRLDLGAIAKGYASDKIRAFLISKGIDKAMINLGGNVYAVGERNKETGDKWRIGIRDPLGEKQYFYLVEVEDMSVVTSGGYERYFEENGKIYHHLLDSKTGYPAESGIISASIVSSDSTLCDALSTAVFVSGVEKANEIATEFGVFIIIETENLEVLTFGVL